MSILSAWKRGLRRRRSSTSELDALIAPEIKNDEFFKALTEVAARQDVRTILEVGASSGEGSTEALVTGALQNPSAPQLYCLEVSRVRFEALTRRWAARPWIHCYNLSSVPLEEFPSRQQVIDFYNTQPSRLRRFHLGEILRWLEQDAAYLREHQLSRSGIDEIKRDAGIDVFDAVLIDGSEFTGKAELTHVYGAGYLMLDDVRTHKNFFNYARLREDPDYALIGENLSLRNGFAIFARRRANPL